MVPEPDFVRQRRLNPEPDAPQEKAQAESDGEKTRESDAPKKKAQAESDGKKTVATAALQKKPQAESDEAFAGFGSKETA